MSRLAATDALIRVGVIRPEAGRKEETGESHAVSLQGSL
jgi:hypothetical protein